MTKKQLLLSFKGRISRKGYCCGLLLLLPFIAALFITDFMLGEYQIFSGTGSNPLTEFAYFLLIATFFAPFLLGLLALNTKRLHDLGFSLWHYMLLCAILLPFPGEYSMAANLALILILACLKGQGRANQYGSNPL